MRNHKILTICLLTAFIAMSLVFISSAQAQEKTAKEISLAHQSITQSWVTGDFESNLYKFVDTILANHVKLGLSEDQVREIKDMEAETKKNIAPMGEKISALDVEINTLSWEEFDLDAINSLVAQKHEIMHQKEQYMVSLHNDLLYKILSAEQRKILKTIVAADQGVVDPDHEELTFEEPGL
jgi:hypothetical protein